MVCRICCRHHFSSFTMEKCSCLQSSLLFFFSSICFYQLLVFGSFVCLPCWISQLLLEQTNFFSTVTLKLLCITYGVKHYVELNRWTRRICLRCVYGNVAHLRILVHVTLQTWHINHCNGLCMKTMFLIRAEVRIPRTTRNLVILFYNLMEFVHCAYVAHQQNPSSNCIRTLNEIIHDFIIIT